MTFVSITTVTKIVDKEKLEKEKCYFVQEFKINITSTVWSNSSMLLTCLIVFILKTYKNSSDSHVIF